MVAKKTKQTKTGVATTGSRTAYDDGVIRRVAFFDGVHDAARPQERLAAVRASALRFRESMLAEKPVTFYRSCELIRVPYPSKYAFLNVSGVHTPYIHILNRLFIIQFESEEGLKTLLVSPSDADGNAETPFFSRLGSMFGPLENMGRRLIAPQASTVEACLAQAGISPNQVDYITYDHLHTQDLRRWMGSEGGRGYFPKAKLLVMRQEWESAQGLLPPQRDWYCPEGLNGVDPERVICLDGDVMLGQGVALVRTPGHTEGNHSIVAHTPEGLMVTSENGVGPDAYAPLSSNIKAVRDYAAMTGQEVILNGNTLERGLDQYISMVQEKEIAGPSVRDPRFPNVVCSSEFAPYWAFAGVRPTFQFGDLSFGQPQ